MPVFDVPIIRIEVAQAIDRYLDGESKIARPNVQPKIVQIRATSMREAVNLALKANPGWAAHPSNIMKARNA